MLRALKAIVPYPYQGCFYIHVFGSPREEQKLDYHAAIEPKGTFHRSLGKTHFCCKCCMPTCGEGARLWNIIESIPTRLHAPFSCGTTQISRQEIPRLKYFPKHPPPSHPPPPHPPLPIYVFCRRKRWWQPRGKSDAPQRTKRPT